MNAGTVKRKMEVSLGHLRVNLIRYRKEYADLYL